MYEVWTMALEEKEYKRDGLPFYRHEWTRRKLVDATPIYEEAVRIAQEHYRDVPSVTVAVFYIHGTMDEDQYFRMDIWETEYREEQQYA